jgi:hypothetical protein
MRTILHPTADLFRRRMRRLAGEAQASGGRVPMREIFALAKEMADMPVREIERLLDDADHGVRVGAVSIMDWQARRRTTDAEARQALFDLYMRRHDRIDNCDLVDPLRPVGGWWISAGRAGRYVRHRGDPRPRRRGSGAQGGRRVDSPGRQADPARLLRFLDRYARTMPRTMLRYALEHQSPETRRHYMQAIDE